MWLFMENIRHRAGPSPEEFAVFRFDKGEEYSSGIRLEPQSCQFQGVKRTSPQGHIGVRFEGERGGTGSMLQHREQPRGKGFTLLTGDPWKAAAAGVGITNWDDRGAGMSQEIGGFHEADSHSYERRLT